MLPERQQYALQTLPSALAYAGQADRLQRVLTDFHFIDAKIKAFGPQPMIDDYDLALVSGLVATDNTLELDTHALRLIQGALRLGSHVLQHDRKQLAEQLLGRLWPQESPAVAALLQQARVAATEQQISPWLCPLTPTLTPAGGPLVRTLIGHMMPVNDLALILDNLDVVSASSDGTIRVWSISNGGVLQTLRGHSDVVIGLAVTSDGHHAISASADTTIKIWDLKSATELRTLRGHTEAVTAVALTPDERLVLSTSADATSKVW